MSIHKEGSFETEICDYLKKHGWLYEGGDAAKAAKRLGLTKTELQKRAKET